MARIARLLYLLLWPLFVFLDVWNVINFVWTEGLDGLQQELHHKALEQTGILMLPTELRAHILVLAARADAEGPRVRRVRDVFDHAPLGWCHRSLGRCSLDAFASFAMQALPLPLVRFMVGGSLMNRHSSGRRRVVEQIIVESLCCDINGTELRKYIARHEPKYEHESAHDRLIRERDDTEHEDRTRSGLEQLRELVIRFLQATFRLRREELSFTLQWSTVSKEAMASGFIPTLNGYINFKPVPSAHNLAYPSMEEWSQIFAAEAIWEAWTFRRSAPPIGVQQSLDEDSALAQEWVVRPVVPIARLRQTGTLTTN